MTDQTPEQRTTMHNLFRRGGGRASDDRLAARISPAERIRTKAKSPASGSTTNAVGEDIQLVQRYVYNPKPTVTSVPVNAPRSRLSRAIRRTREPGLHVGAWRAEGRIHFDPAATTDSLREAKTEAKRTEQHAIYDRKTGDDIVLYGKGGYRCAMHK